MTSPEKGAGYVVIRRLGETGTFPPVVEDLQRALDIAELLENEHPGWTLEVRPVGQPLDVTKTKESQ